MFRSNACLEEKSFFSGLIARLDHLLHSQSYEIRVAQQWQRGESLDQHTHLFGFVKVVVVVCVGGYVFEQFVPPEKYDVEIYELTE